MGRLFIGCSGWNYGSLPDEDGGWIGVFYPDKETKRLRYYSEFFNTAEMDVKKDVIKDFEGFLEKISPLRKSSKLGAILIQLPPSFTVNEFKNVESFLDEISSSANRDGESTREYENGTTTNNHQYAVEFRHPSWKTEGPWELLRHYNIAAVITDSPAKENLEFLSETTITTADHSFVRFHGNRQDKGTDQCS